MNSSSSDELFVPYSDPNALVSLVLHTFGIGLAFVVYANTIIKALVEHKTKNVVLLLFALPNFYTVCFVIAGWFINALLAMKILVPVSFCVEFSAAFIFSLGVFAASYLGRMMSLYNNLCRSKGPNKMFGRFNFVLFLLIVIFHGALAARNASLIGSNKCDSLFGVLEVELLYICYAFIGLVCILCAWKFMFTHTLFFLESIITFILFLVFVTSTLVMVAKFSPIPPAYLLAAFLNWTPCILNLTALQIKWTYDKKVRNCCTNFFKGSYSQVQNATDEDDEDEDMIETEEEENDQRKLLNNQSKNPTNVVVNHSNLEDIVYSQDLWQPLSLDILQKVKREDAVFDLDPNTEEHYSVKRLMLNKAKYNPVTIDQDSLHNAFLILLFIQQRRIVQKSFFDSLILLLRRVQYMIVFPDFASIHIPQLFKHKKCFADVFKELDNTLLPFDTKTESVVVKDILVNTSALITDQLVTLLLE